MLDKIVKFVLKIVVLVICAPTTYSVVGVWFGDLDPILRTVVQVSAVVGIEGWLLYEWYQLERYPNAETAIRVRRVVSMAVLYFAQLVFAVAHGESVGGVALRLVFSVPMFGSAVDVFILAWRTSIGRTDKSVENSGEVKKHRRKLQIQYAKRENDAKFSVQSAWLAKNENAAMAHIEHTNLNASPGGVPNDALYDAVWPTWFDNGKMPKNEYKKQVAWLLEKDSTLSNYELAKQVNVSESSVRRYRKELAQQNGSNNVR